MKEAEAEASHPGQQPKWSLSVSPLFGTLQTNMRERGRGGQSASPTGCLSGSEQVGFALLAPLTCTLAHTEAEAPCRSTLLDLYPCTQ